MKNLFHTKAVVNKDNIDDSGVINAIVGSTAVLDRAGDVIDQGGWDLSNFKENPVILWGHNVQEEKPPIGKAIKVWIEDKGKETAKLMFQVKFDLQDKFAAEIFRKVKEGFINTVSVGFLPSEWIELDPDNWFGGRKYTKQELLELSFVPVPANPEAVVTLRSISKKDKRFAPVEEKDLFPQVKDDRDEKKEELDMKENKEKENKDYEELMTSVWKRREFSKTLKDVVKTGRTLSAKNEEKIKAAVELLEEVLSSMDDEPMDDNKSVSKKVIPYKDLGTLPESEPWDGQGEIAKAEVSDLKLMCAWYDEEEPDVKGSYKLPHHKADGEHEAVWRGVTSAMAALMGSRGGVELPEGDRKGVYNHLVKHYEEFDKEAPEFKMVQDQVLAGLDEEINAILLEKSEKYEVRLLKKLLKEVKDQKKEQKPQMEDIVTSLRIIDKSLDDLLPKRN